LNIALVDKMMRQNQLLNKKIDKLQLTLDELVESSNNSSNNLDIAFIEVISYFIIDIIQL
jgi:hypothetical protein